MEQREVFEPVHTFSWEINRSERTRQARWLVPLLGVVAFQLECGLLTYVQAS